VYMSQAVDLQQPKNRELVKKEAKEIKRDGRRVQTC
jgi:hypothetical protein